MDHRRHLETMSLPSRFELPLEAPTPLGLQGTHHRTYKRPISVQIGKRWREIQGLTNNWEELLPNPDHKLDPCKPKEKPEPKLDECLRAELIRYGQFAQVAYDAFDYDQYSQYCGSCLYSKRNLFRDVDLHDTGYTVTRYLYATADVAGDGFLMKAERPDAWSTKSNWIGYIAVCTDERELERLGRRDIVIVWRGTVTKLEWTADVQFHLTRCSSKIVDIKKSDESHMKVEAGFQNLYLSKKEDSRFNKNSAQEWLLKGLKDTIEEHKSGHELSITICGHSLGSALAILSAYDLAAIHANEVDVGGKKVTIPITVFSYAGPCVGNHYFKERIEELGIRVLRVVNKNDLVPRLLTNMFHLPGKGYKHVGKVLILDDNDSEHLDHDKVPFAHKIKLEGLHQFAKMVSPEEHHNGSIFCLQHNLEVHLHLIDGYGRYDVPPSRDPVLVNKHCGFLKHNKYVPENWWKLKNTGSIIKYSKDENRYYQPDRLVEDVPIPPKSHVVAEATAYKKILSMKITD